MVLQCPLFINNGKVWDHVLKIVSQCPSTFVGYRRNVHLNNITVNYINVSLDIDGKDKVIVIGEYGVELYDGVAWEVLEEFPAEIYDPQVVFYKGKVIVTGDQLFMFKLLKSITEKFFRLSIGGAYGQQPILTSWEFDINTRTWAPGFPLNPPIYDHVSFLVPDSFCV